MPLTDSATETIIFFKSRNFIWKRWVENYNERTRLMMNLFFNIASQVDNRTNLQIADLTSKISMEAKRDSSSMITIAAVTMVFLPGTFISVRHQLLLSSKEFRTNILPGNLQYGLLQYRYGQQRQSNSDCIASMVVLSNDHDPIDHNSIHCVAMVAAAARGWHRPCRLEKIKKPGHFALGVTPISYTTLASTPAR